jgi:hypothetical protein
LIAFLRFLGCNAQKREKKLPASKQIFIGMNLTCLFVKKTRKNGHKVVGKIKVDIISILFICIYFLIGQLGCFHPQ